jgi:hypothetical protein
MLVRDPADCALKRRVLVWLIGHRQLPPAILLKAKSPVKLAAAAAGKRRETEDWKPEARRGIAAQRASPCLLQAASYTPPSEITGRI